MVPPLQWTLRRSVSVASLVLLAGFCSTAVVADDTDTLELFEKQIRPTLIAQCIRCHGSEKQQGGLNLESRDGWSDGGDSGPAIVPGDQTSLLLRAISYEDSELEMPPRGKLPEKTIEAFRAWVAGGAMDPRVADQKPSADHSVPTVQQGRNFWSFRPVTPPDVPEVEHADWPRNDIDRFVLSRLEHAGLTPVDDAEAVMLLRRLHYDLTGMPPTPQQIEAFLSDRSPTAYDDLVNRLLDSHHFGERWGRHWLDVVRFAESSGGGRTLLFPDAWRYRDFVVDSFNRDLPYDEFLTAQIAGDLLDTDDWEQRQRQIVATAFLLLGPINYEMQDKEILEMDVVDEQLDTIGKALMGMTLGCARCHDHKFDPIPTHDYYAIAGILKGTKSLVHSNVSKWNTVELPMSPADELALQVHAKRREEIKQRLADATQRWQKAGGKPDNKARDASINPDKILGIVLDDTRAERVGEWTESTSIPGYVGDHYIHDGTESKGDKRVIYRPQLPEPGRYEVLVSYTPSGNRSSRVPVHVHHADGEEIVRINQKEPATTERSFVSLGVFPFEAEKNPRVIISNEGTADGVVIADAVIFRSLATRSAGQNDQQALAASQNSPASVQSDREVLKRLKETVDRITAELKEFDQSSPTRPVAMATTDADEPCDIPLAIRGQVHLKGPVTPRGVLQVAQWEPFPQPGQGRSGRKELAEWLVDPRHPLTARVMANRIWYWLFGRGIVSTVDNFGSMGESPSHPELLDHLAVTFIRQGWSIKQLIREIVRSRVYRLSSNVGASTSLIEHTRVDPDNHLIWHMNRKRLRAEDIRDSLLMVSGELDFRSGGPGIKPGTQIEYGYTFDSSRRSVYVPVFRNALPEVFEVFDFADPNIQLGRRNTSTVASQALLLMNHPRVIKSCRLAADRLLEIHGFDTDQRIRYAHLQVLGRPPHPAEYAVAVDLVGSPSDNEAASTRWAMLYQVLFQSLDFRYLD